MSDAEIEAVLREAGIISGAPVTRVERLLAAALVEARADAKRRMRELTRTQANAERWRQAKERIADERDAALRRAEDAEGRLRFYHAANSDD